MKITNVQTFLVHPGGGKNWLFVKVETDEGIHGWGECYTQADRDRTIEIHVHQLGRYLVGRDPFNIKHFTFMAYHDFARQARFNGILLRHKWNRARLVGHRGEGAEHSGL